MAKFQIHSSFVISARFAAALVRRAEAGIQGTKAMLDVRRSLPAVAGGRDRKMSLHIAHNFFEANTVILVLVLWQLISAYLMTVGPWPLWVGWVNAALVALFILCSKPLNGLVLFILSVPFFTVLPQGWSETLSSWRPLVIVLFVRCLWDFCCRERVSLRWSSLLAYERLALALGVWAAISLFWARYPGHGMGQLVFLVNAALLYPVAVRAVSSHEDLRQVLRAAAISTGIILALGYAQFIATFFVDTYYFWQYWALWVASVLYGLPLAKVLEYSNSWVTVSGEVKTLRMFSIMPSSHAFAMAVIFFCGFLLPLVGARNIVSHKNGRRLDKLLWAAAVLACLAVILSGTRGVWVGMVPALLLAGWLYYRSKLRQFVSPVFAAMLLVVILFTASPLLDKGLGYMRSLGQGTLDRAASIIDLKETSNAGRLAMWRQASMFVLTHPWGAGYGNFISAVSGDVASYETAASRPNARYNLPQRYVTAHSLYLQIAVELGWLGLLLFTGLWAIFFHTVWRYWKMQTAVVNEEKIFLATFGLILVWFLAYSVFDLTWFNDKLLLYTFIGLGLLHFRLASACNNMRDGVVL